MDSLNFGLWYVNLIIQKGKIFAYGSSKGTFILLPNGMALWNRIKKLFTFKLIKLEYKEVCMPSLIRQDIFNIEKEHLEGFKPNIALVTKMGDENIIPIIIRPTSEVIVCNDLYPVLVQSYKDLPLKIVQWCNIVRNENNPRPLLRSVEFLWHEMHSFFITLEDAKAEILKIIKAYKIFINKICCLPIYIGKKPEWDKFSGASITYGFETLLQDGNSIQVATVHLLSEKLPNAFKLSFISKNNIKEVPYYISAGFSTRLLGSLLAIHGDEEGLIIPPFLADIQVKIIQAHALDNVSIFINMIIKELKIYRIRVEKSRYSKFNKDEFKETIEFGIPIIFIIGNEEESQNIITYYTRNTKKKKILLLNEINNNLGEYIINELKDINKYMYFKAKKNLIEHTLFSDTLEQLMSNIYDNKSYGVCNLCMNRECVLAIKNIVKVSIRLVLKEKLGKCIICSFQTKNLVLLARE